MEIHQLVHTLNYGDAISGEALAIKHFCDEASIESKIFSLNAHEKLRASAVNWNNLLSFPMIEKTSQSSSQTSRGILLFHYSLASPLDKVFEEAVSYKRVLLYHNLTPAHWFTRYNTRVASDLRIGRETLPRLIQHADFLWADSEFNRQELLEFGATNVSILPLLLDTKKWAISANRGIEGILRGHGGKNILHVGRMAPNKCIQDIIKAFYFYHHKIEKKSRLWLVGLDTDTEIYSFELRRLVSELRLQEAVFFCGAVANTELKAFYECSDLYLCMSEHEGFCVPLLEAMYFGVPIIAFQAGAIEETLANGGLLLLRKSPTETAELMNLVLSEQTLRKKLIEEGKKRVQDFSPSAFYERLKTLVVVQGNALDRNSVTAQ